MISSALLPCACRHTGGAGSDTVATNDLPSFLLRMLLHSSSDEEWALLGHSEPVFSCFRRASPARN